MIYLKQAYQQSIHQEIAFKILPTIAQKEVFQYRELNCNTAKQCRNDQIARTKAPFKRLMKNLGPEIYTFDHFAEWCAMPTGQLQNYIAWCVKRFADCTYYIDNNQYVGHLKGAKHIWYNVVAIPVRRFQ